MGQILTQKTVSNVVATIKYNAYIGVLILLLLACYGPSDSDNTAFKRLEERYSDLYSFEYDGDLYLWANAKQGTTVKDEDITTIYKLFFFEKNGNKISKRNSSYVYLNISDANGTFLYQIAYDFNKNAFVKGQTPHY